MFILVCILCRIFACVRGFLHLFLEMPDGTVVAKTANPAVPTSLLQEVMTWKKQGISMSDTIDRLRSRTIPEGYTPHTWNRGI